MKKVLVIAPYAYLPYYSGGQKFIARFLHHLSLSTELTVLSVAENDFCLAGTYKIVPLLKKSFARYYDISLIKKIAAIVKEGGFDAIIWEHPYYAWLAFTIRRRTGVKTFIHTHNIEYQRFKSTGRWWWPVLKWYEKRSFRKADGIFFITPDDRQFAIDKWKIEPSKCVDLPFGVDIKEYPADRAAFRQIITNRHGISPDEKIVLFTGALEYKPNLDALDAILNTINPLLLENKEFRYKIIICGKGLPPSMSELKEYTDKNIIYAGFVSEIDTYYKAADIFLNPVLTGGGVKTKMVEAIACGVTVVSTETGATGIEDNKCGNKMIVVPDRDWKLFARKVLTAENNSETPDAFYKYYYWTEIVQRISPQL